MWIHKPLFDSKLCLSLIFSGVVTSNTLEKAMPTNGIMRRFKMKTMKQSAVTLVMSAVLVIGLQYVAFAADNDTTTNTTAGVGQDVKNDRHDVRKDWRDIRGDRKDLRKDWQDKKDDRKELRQDRKDFRQDMKQLHQDKKAGLDVTQDLQKIKGDRKELRGDKKELKRDIKDTRGNRRDLHRDKKDLRHDVRDLRQDRREGHFGGLHLGNHRR